MWPLPSSYGQPSISSPRSWARRRHSPRHHLVNVGQFFVGQPDSQGSHRHLIGVRGGGEDDLALQLALVLGEVVFGANWRVDGLAADDAVGGRAGLDEVAATWPQGLATPLGRWLRPDGGYILEIKSIDASGAMQADYFNPNPIHVAKAEVKAQPTRLTPP